MHTPEKLKELAEAMGKYDPSVIKATIHGEWRHECWIGRGHCDGYKFDPEHRRNKEQAFEVLEWLIKEGGSPGFDCNYNVDPMEFIIEYSDLRVVKDNTLSKAILSAAFKLLEGVKGDDSDTPEIFPGTLEALDNLSIKPKD